MGKKRSEDVQQAGSSSQAIQRIAEPLATELGLEFVEVVFQRESRGKCLCLFLDKEGGLTLDDCERYHKKVQPFLEDVAYDFLEVSSPGIDRPIKTQRDFEKNKDQLVEVKLFVPFEGSKVHQGLLHAMDDSNVTLVTEDRPPKEIVFLRKAVAIMRPVLCLDGLDEDEV